MDRKHLISTFRDFGNFAVDKNTRFADIAERKKKPGKMRGWKFEIYLNVCISATENPVSTDEKYSAVRNPVH